MRAFLRKFFRVFFILWGLAGMAAGLMFACIVYFFTVENKDRERHGGDLGDVAFMFSHGAEGIGESNFERVEYRYDSFRSFNGDGVSVYIVKTKNVDVSRLDKSFWFGHDNRPAPIGEALGFLKMFENMPDIAFDGKDVYVAPIFIRKYDSNVYDATLLVYDAFYGRLYFLDANI